ncbi:MAG: c-type cytochrome [Acidobacteriota bacterium]
MHQIIAFQRHRRVRQGLVLLSSLVFFVLALGHLAEAAPPSQSPGEGQALFQQKCVGCHSIGGGKLVGPDLKGVTTRRTTEWLTNWISAPDKVLAAKDPIATQLLAEHNNLAMPNLGLSLDQVASLIAFLGTDTVTTPQSAQAAGDPAAGKALFTGSQRLKNGGPPCMGCHSVGAIGSLGGGALGPDLTGAYNKYGGDAGLASFLNSVPTVTMNAVWTRQPLAPQEQADLVAFLKQASVTERPIDAVGQLTLLAIGGTVLFLILAQLYWRKRLVAVRRPMVLRSKF